MRITAVEFQRNIGFYQSEALKAPVYISRNGHQHLVLLSATTYQALVPDADLSPTEKSKKKPAAGDKNRRK